MPAPSVKVELGLNLGQADPLSFTLDSGTRGLLDNTSFTLGGERFFDVTDRLLKVSVTRGKNSTLDRIDAGQTNAAFDNSDRTFDPLYVNGPYYGQLIPRRALRVSANNKPVFLGSIDDLDITYEPGNRSTTTFNAADAFSVLTISGLNEFTPSSELSGARINTVLNRPEIAWPAEQRNIDTGNSTMLAALVEEATSALEYLQLVGSSEFGNLFIAKDGKITFRERNAVPNTPSVLFTDEIVGGEYLGIPFSTVNNVYGSENLYNRIVISNAESPAKTATAEDAESQLLYGPRTYSATGLLIQEQTQLDFLADFLLASFKEPQYRFDSISVVMDILTPAQQDTLLDLEIGDIVQVRFMPSGIAPAVEQYCRVIGVAHDWSDAQKLTTFGLETLDFAIFILDNAVLGELDNDRLAYE